MACSSTPPLERPAVGAAKLARGHFVAQDGSVLPVRAWWPREGGAASAIILALHGFNDYGRAFALPGRYFSQHGIALIAYDQRGFGNSPHRGRWAGTEIYESDLLTLLHEIRKQHENLPVFVLGESMGGAIAIAGLASPDAPEIDGLILSAPAVWSRDSMPWYQQVILALASGTMPELELTGSGLGIQASDNIAMLRDLSRDPLVIKSTRVDAIKGLADLMDVAKVSAGRLHLPVLVLYGEKDQVIPRAPVHEFINAMPLNPGSQSATYPDGYHLLLRDIHAEVPLRDIVTWINNHTRPLPSGFAKPLPLSALSE